MRNLDELRALFKLDWHEQRHSAGCECGSDEFAVKYHRALEVLAESLGVPVIELVEPPPLSPEEEEAWDTAVEANREATMNSHMGLPLAQTPVQAAQLLMQALWGFSQEAQEAGSAPGHTDGVDRAFELAYYGGVVESRMVEDEGRPTTDLEKGTSDD